ncbi:MAG: FliM/FliN family flagellar motor switch protein [Gaiellales bacterium]
MTSDEALHQLAESTAVAAKGVLDMCVGDSTSVEYGTAGIVTSGASPVDGLVVPAVITSVSYVDGVRGGNVFSITLLGARRLAARMMGADLPDDADTEPSELDVSAVSEAMNQMMAGAAGATSVVLEQEVEIGAPQTLIIRSSNEATDLLDQSAMAITTPFTIFGEPARLIQLVPNAFVVKMTKALAELAAETVDETATELDELVPSDVLQDVKVRLSAELGRFTMAVARAVSMSPGSVVELDRGADEPVELYVNGLPFGQAALVVTEDGSWGVRVGRIYARESLPAIGSVTEGR